MRQLVAIDSYIKARYEANPEKYLSENLGLKKSCGSDSRCKI